MNRREFMQLGAMAVLAGCAGGRRGRAAKFAMNASTLRGYKLSLLDQMKAVAASGFKGYEPWMADIRSAKKKGELETIRKIADDAGVSFVNGIAFGQWVHPDSKIRAAGLEETKRDMALLAEMGCTRVAASMFGVQQKGFAKVPNEAIAERYAAVLDLGKEMGVKPLLEYWGHSVNLSRLEDALAVLNILNRPDAAILADVYHTYRGGSSFAAFENLSPEQLPVLHVNDYTAAKQREHLTDPDRVWPGDGIAPWKDLFATMDKRGLDPWLSIELFNPEYWRTTPADTLRVGLEKMTALDGGIYS